jgi:acetylornithine deacetylase/succinyl-diaminopimelate desuccinylase-like protein
VTLGAEAPSRRLDATTWDRAGVELIETVRDLIRIPSINPAPPDAPDGELVAARRIAQMLGEAGLEPEVVEPVPGRGSVHVRLRGDGTGGEPLLLLSHLDVVPAPVERWSHDPFAADLVDGYVYGRGAVDMKAMIAMELAVVRLLAAEAQAAGLDPARDPIPGLRRDVLFTCTADEEAGGLAGAKWVAENRPDWLRAAGALNECGGVSATIAGRRFYPIQVAEKGFAAYRIAIRGTWGHGSMPRDDNAAVRAATAVTRLAVPGTPRPAAVMEAFLRGVAEHLDPEGARLVQALLSDDPRRGEAAIDALCDPTRARILRSLLRDTISPTVVHAGIKYNVIPGEATVEIDCRVLPGTTEEDMREIVVGRLGDLVAHVDVELVIHAPAVAAPADGEVYALLARTVRDHDPDGIPLPFMVPFATDAKHTAVLGIPTYGFSPLRLGPEDEFLDRFHGVDERVGIDALRWGLPVLYDVVRRFCG